MSKNITLAHGAGGKQTSELIKNVFARYFKNPYLTEDDAAVLPSPKGKTAISTDGFIVSPFEFPGGNIGKLSICGTVNDLACMGAKPLYISCAFVIEEGFPLDKLDMIASSMADTAAEVGVKIVSGDTKVAGKGQMDGIFITTTGVGEISSDLTMNGAKAMPGDAVIVSGDIGRHGTTIMLERDNFGMKSDISSDCAPLWEPVRTLLGAGYAPHVIRDATRGGVGTVLHEIAAQANVGVRLDSQSIPVDDAVKGVCGMLGLEPLYLACEGRVVIIAPASDAEGIVEILRKCRYTEGAAIIGTVTDEMKGHVTMMTELGTETFLPVPAGELLPRIC